MGTVTWTTPENITASDTVYAVAALGGTVVSHYLVGTQFGFALPSGATVTGIKFTWIRLKTSANGVTDNSVRLWIAGAASGNDKATATQWSLTTPETVEYGGPGDTWGLSLVGSDINATNFGVAVSAKGTTPGGKQGWVDSFTLTIYY